MKYVVSPPTPSNSQHPMGRTTANWLLDTKSVELVPMPQLRASRLSSLSDASQWSQVTHASDQVQKWEFLWPQLHAQKFNRTVDQTHETRFTVLRLIYTVKLREQKWEEICRVKEEWRCLECPQGPGEHSTVTTPPLVPTTKAIRMTVFMDFYWRVTK